MIVQQAGATIARIDLIPAYMQFNFEDFGFIADELFPVQPVLADAGAFGTVAPQEMLQLVDTQRAPNAPSVELNFSLTNDNFLILEYGAKQFCDDQLQARYGGWINQQDFATKQIRAAIQRDKERRAAALVQNTGAYPTQPAAAMWTSTSTADSFGDVATAKEAFLKRYGVLPNTMIINYGTKLALTRGDQVRKAMTQNYGPVVPVEIPDDRLAFLYDIENVKVTRSVYNSANPAQALSASYIWAQTMVVLAYVGGSGTGGGMPVMGEQLIRDEGGAGVAIESWRQPDPSGTWVKAKTKQQLKMNPNAPVLIITGVSA